MFHYLISDLKVNILEFICLLQCIYRVLLMLLSKCAGYSLAIRGNTVGHSCGGPACMGVLRASSLSCAPVLSGKPGKGET